MMTAAIFREKRSEARAGSDAEGRVTYPALIPGAPCRIVDRAGVFRCGEPAIRKEFTVKPGETVDLGTITIGQP